MGDSMHKPKTFTKPFFHKGTRIRKILRKNGRENKNLMRIPDMRL
jgi:hypothetical protein